MIAIRRLQRVGPGGRLVVNHLGVADGTEVEVIVLVDDASGDRQRDDLLAAAEGSLEFWDNPIDDEAWKDA